VAIYLRRLRHGSVALPQVANVKAYVLANIRVLDPERMKIYSQMATSVVAQFGGRYLVRGGALQVLEGTPSVERVVIIEFPDESSARAWWESAEYQDAKRLRQEIAQSDLILIEGLG
jgi:uncharacterized protein (DUF1330 family)